MLAILPVVADKVSLRYGTVPQAEVERRLNAFEDSNSKREAKLKVLFEEAGCSGDQLSEQKVPHASAPNVVCTLPGEVDSEIVVGGHFDFVNSGKGVVDNWSGCSLLPSLYQSVKAVPRRHQFVFIGFTDEEKGLVGSKFYVHKLSKEELARISGMVNLDTLGLSSTKVELDGADKKMAHALAAIADTLKLPVDVVNVHKVGRSDSDSFQDRKVPSISIHSLTQETLRILHSPKDQMEAMQINDYYNTYLLMRAYLMYLDQVLPAD